MTTTELLAAHREMEADGERPSSLAEVAEDIVQAQAAIRRQNEPAVPTRAEVYRDALRDLVNGAQMMLDIVPIVDESSLSRYAREVKRVAEAALRGNA